MRKDYLCRHFHFIRKLDENQDMQDIRKGIKILLLHNYRYNKVHLNFAKMKKALSTKEYVHSSNFDSNTLAQIIKI